MCGGRRAGLRPGFTLLEAVVALAIVAVVTVAALAALGAELRTAGRAQAAVPAAALAQDRLAAIALLDVRDLDPLPDSVAEGRFAAPFEAYGWTAETRPVLGEGGLYDVVVRIEWSDDGVYTLRSRLYRPAREVAR